MIYKDISDIDTCINQNMKICKGCKDCAILTRENEALICMATLIEHSRSAIYKCYNQIKIQEKL